MLKQSYYYTIKNKANFPVPYFWLLCTEVYGLSCICLYMLSTDSYES